MPFPDPDGPAPPIKIGEWGCLTLLIVLTVYSIAVAVLT